MFDLREEQQKLIDFVSRYSKQSEVLIVGFSSKWPLDQKDYLKDTLKTFFSNWHAHEKKLEADFFLFCDRFLVVVIDSGTLASGCARDNFFNTMKKLVREQKEQKLTLLNSNDIVIAKSPSVENAKSPSVENAQRENGQADCDFIVLQRYQVEQFIRKQKSDDLKKINLMGLHLNSVKQITDGELVQPFHKSWLAKFSEPITT